MATFKTFVLTAAIDGDVNADTLADELERITHGEKCKTPLVSTGCTVVGD